MITKNSAILALFIGLGLTLGGPILSYAAVGTPATCPILTGSYLCKSEGKDVTLILAQEIVNNQTIYTLTEDNQSTQLPSDNVEYKIDDKANNITGTARFVCEHQSFNSYLKGQRTDGTAKVIESWDLVQGLSLDGVKNLSVHVKGSSMSQGVTKPVDDLSSCLRTASSALKTK